MFRILNRVPHALDFSLPLRAAVPPIAPVEKQTPPAFNIGRERGCHRMGHRNESAAIVERRTIGNLLNDRGQRIGIDRN